MATEGSGGQPAEPSGGQPAGRRRRLAGAAAAGGSDMADAQDAAGAGRVDERANAAAQSERRRRAARAQCSFDIRLSLFSLLMHGATQLVSLMAWPSLPASERFQRCLSILYACTPVALPLWAPEFYLRWRPWVFIVYRIGFFQFPLLRKPRGIQKVLDDLPQPGARGVVKSLAKIVWGSRLVAVIASAVMTPLSLVPLVPQLALLLYSVAMVRNNNTLCSTALLTAPLTQRRIDTFHSGMHLLALVLPGGIGQAISPRLAATSQQQHCEAFLTFIFASTGLLLPLAILVKTEPPTSLRAWELRALRGDRLSGKSRLRVAASRVSEAVEGGVRMLCGRSWFAVGEAAGATAVAAATADAPSSRRTAPLSLHGWQRALAWWLVLSLIWAAAFEHNSCSGLI